MSKDWKKIARGNRLEIPEADLERILATLDGLEAAFRPLARGLPQDSEPASIFRAEEEGE